MLQIVKKQGMRFLNQIRAGLQPVSTCQFFLDFVQTSISYVSICVLVHTRTCVCMNVRAYVYPPRLLITTHVK